MLYKKIPCTGAGDFFKTSPFLHGRLAHYGKSCFGRSFSLIVKCKDQQEIDKYWYKLSAVPESEQCGWLKDQYGVSWQIVPDNIDELLNDGPKDEIKRMQQAILEMKKIDIEALKQAR